MTGAMTRGYTLRLMGHGETLDITDAIRRYHEAAQKHEVALAAVIDVLPVPRQDDSGTGPGDGVAAWFDPEGGE